MEDLLPTSSITLWDEIHVADVTGRRKNVNYKVWLNTPWCRRRLWVCAFPCLHSPLAWLGLQLHEPRKRRRKQHTKADTCNDWLCDCSQQMWGPAEWLGPRTMEPDQLDPSPALATLLAVWPCASHLPRWASVFSSVKWGLKILPTFWGG